MIERLYRIAPAFLFLGTLLVGSLLAWWFSTGSMEATLAAGHGGSDLAVQLLLGVPVATGVLCVLAARLRKGLASLNAAYQEGRTLFVQRILAPREAALSARIQSLEQLAATAGLRDGILRARGLVVTRDGGAGSFAVDIADDGAALLTLESGKGDASISALVYEKGCGLAFRDPTEQLRLCATVTREHVCMNLNGPAEEVRAGFVVDGAEPTLLLLQSPARRQAEEAEKPGYL